MFWLRLVYKNQKLFFELSEDNSFADVKQMLITTYHLSDKTQFLYENMTVNESQFHSPIPSLHIFRNKDLNNVEIIIYDSENSNQDDRIQGPADLSADVLLRLDPNIILTSTGRSATTSHVSSSTISKP